LRDQLAGNFVFTAFGRSFERAIIPRREPSLRL
jgi:hypothetical protein